MAVIWEAFTAYLDDRFEENKASRELLSKVYKELMILGFIGFCLIMSKELGVSLPRLNMDSVPLGPGLGLRPPSVARGVHPPTNHAPAAAVCHTATH